MRASSLARYFPGQGIRLDVLTARNASAVGTDLRLLKEIPPEVTVHRTITLDLPFALKKRIKKLVTGSKSKPAPAVSAAHAAAPAKAGFLKRLLQRAMQPDPQVTWLPVLTRAARRIVRDRKIDLVVITVPPFSSTLLVEKLRKNFPSLAIVVDFRDEWLTTSFDGVSFLFTTTAESRARAERIEKSAIQNATAIVTVTEAARRQILSRYPNEPDNKFHLIPNGFDSTRLQRSQAPAEPRADGKILITHVGTVYATGAPTSIVEALQSLPPEIRQRFKLRFIGHIEEQGFRDALLGLGEIVEIRGYLPQHEALALMNETDYVLLINHDPLNVGGKFYDYVGGGKPILGAVHPQGETRRLLDELRAGWWAANDDVPGIRQLFLDAASRGPSLQTDFQPDTEKIAHYERKALAIRYAALLASIAGPGA
jgi:hypothetical protein